jgi:hypothetical protein
MPTRANASGRLRFRAVDILIDADAFAVTELDLDHCRFVSWLPAAFQSMECFPAKARAPRS